MAETAWREPHAAHWPSGVAVGSGDTRSGGIGEPVQAPEACPTCRSPDPKRHPAVQHEGEVQVCQDVFHHSKWPCFFCCSPRAHYVVRSGLSTIPACIDCERRRPAGADEVAAALSRPGPRPETVLPEDARCFHVEAGKRCTRYLEGSNAEREAVVAWLRKLGEDSSLIYALNCADMIEKGRHLRAPEKPVEQKP